jgi:hypothetical protein
MSGNSGMSNAIMSIEIGVVLAFLTNRFLLLEGNITPPANVVSYGGRVDNKNPSRVTDLIDLPVPWNEPGGVDMGSLRSRELTDQHLMDSVFYVPGTVDIESSDAASFARGRKTWLCETEELAEVPVLMVSEDPVVPEQGRKRNNLGFYSYFFYFDDETRRAAYQVLERMRPKGPYAELAQRVAADIGRFNAVHMRRGDFKVTYGVTVLDRQPWEAIDAMDRHFSRDERLLICTDERDDPFFDEIKQAWPDPVFIDHHILDNYGKEFFALPQHDSIALAYLSQLVAAESQDFIGTMTSTFTSMIQRFRGNRGKPELFKFLWNELPDPGERAERGRHPVSDCVPLENGIMVEELEGPYSWNRYTNLINPAWMREWPESFLTESVLETGALADHAPLVSPDTAARAARVEAQLQFEGLRVKIKSSVPGLAFKLTEMLYSGDDAGAGNVVASISVDHRDGRYEICANGHLVGNAETEGEAPAAIVRHLAKLLGDARRTHSWFDGMVFQRSGRSIVYTGDPGQDEDMIADALCSSGWEMMGDVAIPVRSQSCEIVPFSRCSWPKGAATRVEHRLRPLTAIVHGTRHLHGRDSVVELSPSVGAAELLTESLDFKFDRERAVKRLCKLVEQVPIFGLSFSRAENASGKLDFLASYQARESKTGQAGD